MQKKVLIVDRIEEDYVVCQTNDKKIIAIKMTQIYGNVLDGDVLIYSDGFYKVDKTLTNKRKNEIKNLVEGMWD